MSILNYLIESLNDFDFDEGDCNIYAVAVHRKYGNPIYAVKGYFEEDGVKGSVISHVFVKAENGKFKDASGEYNEAQIKAKSDTGYFVKTEIVPLSGEEAIGVFCDEPVDDFDDLMIGNEYDDLYDFDEYPENSGNEQCVADAEAKVKTVMKMI